MVNLRRSNWYCETTLCSTGYLLGYLYCFIASYIGYIYKRHRPRTLLNSSRRRFGVEFIWEGILFQIFEPKTFKLLSPFLTWYGLVTLRFKSLCFRAGLFENVSHKSWIKKIYCLVSCIFLNTDNSILLFSLYFSLCLSKGWSSYFRSHCTTVAKLSFIYFPFYSWIYMYKNAILKDNI